MKKRLKYIAVVLAICCGFNASAQLYINDTFSGNAGSLVFVNGDVVYAGDKQQKISQHGTIEVKGNWNNISVNDTKVFTDESTGQVIFSGALQTFNGLTTRFPNLVLGGTDLKRQNTAIEIRQSLDLSDRELDVNGHTAFVLSDNEDAIKQTTGYVNTSSSKEGFLIRTLSNNSTYLYPLGNSINGVYRYRPLSVKADKNGAIGCQFQNYKADKDYYNIEDTKDGVKGVNEHFYHGLIAKDVDNKVSLTIAFNTADDGAFENITNWDETVRKWSLVKTSSPSESGFRTATANLSTAEKLSLTTSAVLPVALAGKYMPDLFIPNVFTPNADHVNDEFVIRGLKENYPENELVIINRWGNEVFKATNYQNDWNGSNFNEGVYFYILKVHAKDGATKSFTGYVHIIR